VSLTMEVGRSEGFPSRLYDIAGETSELSLESAIEGRSDRSICAFPSGVAKKSVLTLIRATITVLRTGGGALCVSADGPRAGAGQSATWPRGWRSFLTGRTIRACRPDGLRLRRGGGVRRHCMDLTPGRDPVGEERS
jgi:hypothetical protein